MVSDLLHHDTAPDVIEAVEAPVVPVSVLAHQQHVQQRSSLGTEGDVHDAEREERILRDDIHGSTRTQAEIRISELGDPVEIGDIAPQPVVDHDRTGLPPDVIGITARIETASGDGVPPAAVHDVISSDVSEILPELADILPLALFLGIAVIVGGPDDVRIALERLQEPVRAAGGGSPGDDPGVLLQFPVDITPGVMLYAGKI